VAVTALLLGRDGDASRSVSVPDIVLRLSLLLYSSRRLHPIAPPHPPAMPIRVGSCLRKVLLGTVARRAILYTFAIVWTQQARILQVSATVAQHAIHMIVARSKRGSDGDPHAFDRLFPAG
jgi:hypothetical protein